MLTVRGMTGRYWPGDSLIHRADPRVKLLGVLGWVVTVMMARQSAGFAILFLLLLGAVAQARLPLRLLVTALRPLAPLALLTVAFASMAGRGGAAFHVGPVSFSEAGFQLGLRYAARIVMLVWGASWLTWTTTPERLASGLLQMLGPLERLGLPIADAVLVSTLALRFIPDLYDEAARIQRSLAARGLRLRGAPVGRRVAILSAMLIPLFTGSLRRADSLATALEVRGWRGRAAAPDCVPGLQWLALGAFWALLALTLWRWR